MSLLETPCSYQGGKQRLAKQIVDIIYQENVIDDNTKFYDLCCGSGSISLELINRGFNPNSIVMIDNGCFGQFWQDIANNEFDLKVFRDEIDKLPQIKDIQSYLKGLGDSPVNIDRMTYHYLLLQSGSFGSKQIWVYDDKWKHHSFRNYWMPTKTSNRKSPVNPMMPMPDTLYRRVHNIVEQLSGCITASREDITKSISRINKESDKVIVYIDPPYLGTTGYETSFDVYSVIQQIKIQCSVYVSEGYEMYGTEKTYLLSGSRPKGNISGDIKKKPIDEWLNKYAVSKTPTKLGKLHNRLRRS